MRLLHTSDWHVGRTVRGRSRAEEHRRVLAEIATVADERNVDMVLVAGDLFDVSAPTPESERIVYRALLDLCDIAPVVVTSGNHDNPRRLEAVAPVFAGANVVVSSKVGRPDEGGRIRFDDLPVTVVPIPWTSQRGIVGADDLMSKDPDDHTASYADRMRRIVAALCDGLTTDTVNVMTGHMMVSGGDLSGSEREVHTNTIFDYAIPSSVFPGDLSYVALGHLHRRQRIPGPGQVWYSGSPMQLDFGEAGDPKGVVVVDAEPGLPATIEEVTISGGIPFVRLDGTLEQVVAAADAITGDAYVKVVLEESMRVGLADEVRDRIGSGVVDVLLAGSDADHRSEVVRPQRLGRSPKELFAEYLADRSVDDPDLVALFDEVHGFVSEGGDA